METIATTETTETKVENKSNDLLNGIIGKTTFEVTPELGRHDFQSVVKILSLC